MSLILCMEYIQKVLSRPMLWGFEKKCGKIGNASTVTLFKQLPQAQIGLKFKKISQIANDQTMFLSPENVQKVDS